MFVLDLPSVNAYAVLFLGWMMFTREAVDIFSDEELEVISAHELAHLNEPLIAKLEPPSRKLIDERYARKMSVAELARSYGRSESWVAVTLFRIRRALHACLTRSELAL